MRPDRPAQASKSGIVIGLLCASATAVAADGTAWWQNIDGHASIGLAAVKAKPDTGGVITLSHDDSGTVGVDKSITGGSGLDTKDYLPVLQLGTRHRPHGGLRPLGSDGRIAGRLA